MNKNYNSTGLTDSVGFELLGFDLGKDVKSSIQAALSEGTYFSEGKTALSIFRNTLKSVIREIENHPKGKLIQDLLIKGPYEKEGEIPENLIDQRLSDSLTAKAISFIYGQMINKFQGALAELLAAKACIPIINEMKNSKVLPAESVLYIGDSILVPKLKGSGYFKGADLHILRKTFSGFEILGVGEIKSYSESYPETLKQIEKHIFRLKRGFKIRNIECSGEMFSIKQNHGSLIPRVVVVPGNWKLPRTFNFKKNSKGHLLYVDEICASDKKDIIYQKRDGVWHITLKWSHEALAEAAYFMTFWYMGEVGKIIYKNSVPWEGMSSIESGQAGYILSDGYWWDRGLIQSYSGDSEFYLPVSVTDQWYNLTEVTWDIHSLAPVEITDPLNNTVTAETDYRVMQPWKQTGANGEISELLFDPLGMVIAMTMYGSENSVDKGDLALSSYTAPSSPTLPGILADPADFVQDSTAYFFYDLTVKAVFTNGGIKVSAVLHFDKDGRLLNFVSNDRFETNGKEYIGNPWETPTSEYRDVDGHRLPSKAKLIYKRPEGDFCYGEFELVSMEYNCREFK